ncbi:MAG: competence protein CoiA family protein, partial [Planctomycetota bacterium]
MLNALNAEDEIIGPVKGADAFCPLCRTKLVAKIGKLEIPRPHWAHRPHADCDPWATEPESEWHRWWKEIVVPLRRKVVIDRDGERHFADIVGVDDQVIEIQ